MKTNDNLQSVYLLDSLRYVVIAHTYGDPCQACIVFSPVYQYEGKQWL